MIPAADCKHSQISMDDSFYLTNIVPQDVHNNAGYIHTVSMRYRRYISTATHTQHPHNTRVQMHTHRRTHILHTHPHMHEQNAHTTATHTQHNTHTKYTIHTHM